MGEKMMMSAHVPVELNEKRKRMGMSWLGLILRGFNAIEQQHDVNALLEDYKALKEKQQRTSKLLQQYADTARAELE